MAFRSMSQFACLLFVLSGATITLAQPGNGSPWCARLTVSATASPVPGVQPALATGTVNVMNGNTNPVQIQEIRVALGNNVPLPPIYTLANCPTTTVPPKRGGLLGKLVCTFAFVLPANGPTSNAAAWTSVQANVNLANSYAVCKSPAGPVTAVRPPILVMG